MVTGLVGMALGAFAATMLRARTFASFALIVFASTAIALVAGGSWLAHASQQPRPALGLTLGIAAALALFMLCIRVVDHMYDARHKRGA
jgi:hypothetical protein